MRGGQLAIEGGGQLAKRQLYVRTCSSVVDPDQDLSSEYGTGTRGVPVPILSTRTKAAVETTVL